MKTPKLLPLLILLAALFAGAVPRVARADVSFEFFHESLSPHGTWIEVADYGYCWQPSGLGDDWAPYQDGYWAYTDAGWTWVSYEDFGSITYHYGRWTRIEDEGWCWVPDNEWGPAWVSWRNSDEHIGWAPLPPEARFERETGISVWVDSSYDIGPDHYSFCGYEDFGAPVLRSVIVPRARNLTIINNTVNITNITYNNSSHVVFNGGPNFARVNERSRRQVPALKLVQKTVINIDGDRDNDRRDGRAGRGRGRGQLARAQQRGNQLEVFAPVIAKPVDGAALRPAKVGKVVPKDKINRGWAGVKDPAQRKALKEKMQAEAKGLNAKTAPAKPMQVADVQDVPQKADPNAPSPTSTAKGKGGKNGRGKDGRADRERPVAAGETDPAAGTDTPEERRRKGQAAAKEPGAKAGGRDGEAPVIAPEQEPAAGAKGRGKGKTDSVALPVPTTPDGGTAPAETAVPAERNALTPRERREAAQARELAEQEATKAKRAERREAVAAREQAEREAAKLKQAERAAAQQQEKATAEQNRKERRAQQRETAAGSEPGVNPNADRSAEVDRAAGQVRRQQAEREAAREQTAGAERRQQQAAEAQGAARREAQRAAAVDERRQQAAQAANSERRQQQMQEQRQQAAQAAAGERRQQQMQEQRQQAAREQQMEGARSRQMEAQRQAQGERQQRAQENQRAAQQQQRQMQIQRQPQPQAAPSGGGGGGRRQLTDEEREARRKARGL